MASAAGNAARLSARFTSRYAPRQAARRGFHAATANHAATNFTMPALSPTMTEGNIAKWNKREGESYVAGDVLLEIETDKATMDVEAQDDGIVFKITLPDESKGVKVGQRIGVMAEEGDDLSSLEMPAEESSASSGGQPARTDRPAPHEETKGRIDKTERSESVAEVSSSSNPNADAAAAGVGAVGAASQRGGTMHHQTYPLYPSVSYLLHENGLSKEEATKIPASGPNGRLLKGDVLAYLGKIEKKYSADQSKRLEKLGQLDLSYTKPAPSTKTPEAASKAAASAAAPKLTKKTEVAMSISLSGVIATQKRVQDTLGIFLPLSTFIARASELANEDLPTSKNGKAASDELFNAVLGLKKAPKMSRGNYIPHVAGLLPTPLLPVSMARKADIIDLLAPKPRKPVVRAAAVPVGESAGANVFSVTAPAGDEKRAAMYLERIKLVLEGEPGRLVL